MAESREDSVLVNLKALRSISEDREAEEREQLRLRAEQARQALEEAERLRRLDAERIVREAEAAKRRAAEAAEQEEREARLRLEEAERRARVEAEARLEETRLRLEIEARAAAGGPARKPVGLVVAVLLLVVGAGGFGLYAYRAQESAEVARRAAQARLAELEAVNAQIRNNQAEWDKANARRRKVLEDELARLKTQQASLEAGKKPTSAPAPTPRPPVAKPPAAAQDNHIVLCPPGTVVCKDSEKK